MEHNYKQLIENGLRNWSLSRLLHYSVSLTFGIFSAIVMISFIFGVLTGIEIRGVIGRATQSNPNSETINRSFWNSGSNHTYPIHGNVIFKPTDHVTQWPSEESKSNASANPNENQKVEVDGLINNGHRGEFSPALLKLQPEGQLPYGVSVNGSTLSFLCQGCYDFFFNATIMLDPGERSAFPDIVAITSDGRILNTEELDCPSMQAVTRPELIHCFLRFKTSLLQGESFTITTAYMQRIQLLIFSVSRVNFPNE